MAHHRKSFFIMTLLTGMIFMVVAAPAYSQEKPQTVQNPATQPPAKPHMLKKRPDRYPTALAGLEVIADLSVDPIRYTGPCPAVFKFNGKITVNRKSVVQYRFIRSDNVRHSLGVLEFEKGGMQEITDTWTFDDPAQLPDFKGWEAIQTNFPMKVRSNLVYFEGTCTDYKGGPATPEAAKLKNPATEKGPKALQWPQPDPLLPPVKR